MIKPPDLAIKLYHMQPIRSLAVDYIQTGTDTADTFVILTSVDGTTSQGKWSSYEKYLKLYVGYNYVACLTREWDEAVFKWLTYEEENKNEIALLRKLKAKHGDV